MKHLKQLSLAVVLIVMLATAAFAGEIPIDKASPSSAPATASTPDQRSILFPENLPMCSASTDSVEIVGLNLLQTLLLMF